MALAPWFGGFGGLFDQFEASSGPFVEIRDEDNAAVMEVEVPRFRPEDIKVSSVGNGRILIEGSLPADRSRQGNFLFADTMMSRFRRSFFFPPNAFDATKFTSSVEHGVLTVRVPKVAQKAPATPQHLAIQGAGQLTTTTSPEEYKTFRKMRWPPQVKVDDTNDKLTYTCALPPSVGREHISLELDGNNLVLSVKYDSKVEKKNASGQVTYSETSSVTNSTTLSVPNGTTTSDITTTYENGNLMVSLAKHPQMIPVSPKLKEAEAKK